MALVLHWVDEGGDDVVFSIMRAYTRENNMIFDMWIVLTMIIIRTSTKLPSFQIQGVLPKQGGERALRAVPIARVQALRRVSLLLLLLFLLNLILIK